MWRRRKFVAFAWIIIIVMLSGCGMSRKTECRELIEEFTRSCNEKDLKAMLNCINPTVSDPIKALLTLGNIVSGQEVDQYIVEVMDSIIGDLEGSDETEEGLDDQLISTIQIEPEKYHVKSEKGTIYCKAVFLINGMDMEKYVNIEVIKKHDTWYIAGITLADEE